jgi:hypothetical protein
VDPLVAKDQKPTSQNKVPPVMHLGLQDGRERGGEREESESEPEKNKRPSVGLLLQSAVSVTEWKSLLYFEEGVGGLQLLATRQWCVAWTV